MDKIEQKAVSHKNKLSGLIKYLLKTLKYTSIIALPCLILFTAFSFWLVSTERGLKTLFFKLPTLASVSVSAKDAKGTVLSGFDIQELSIHTDDADIQLSALNVAWMDKPQKQAFLHLKHIQLGDLSILPLSSPPKKQKPAKLPKDIGLPFGMDLIIENISVNHVFLGKTQDILFLPSQLEFRYTNKQYHLNIASLNTPWSLSQGVIELHNNKNFPLIGQIHTEGSLEEKEITGDVILSGSLEHSHIISHMIGEGMVLNLNAEFQAFHHDPIQKIQKILLTGGSINPQAFWPTLPIANLSFYANMVPRKDKLHADFILVNNDARPLNDSGIPVTDLNAYFYIDQSNDLTLPSLTVSLLNQALITANGTISGKNQALDFHIHTKNNRLNNFVSLDILGELTGNIWVKGKLEEPIIEWDVTNPKLHLTGLLTLISDTNKKQQRLLLEDVVLSDGKKGKINASGILNLFHDLAYHVKLTSEHFNPQHLDGILPDGDINASLLLDGKIKPNIELKSLLDIEKSQLAGKPLNVSSVLNIADGHINNTDTTITLDSNRIFLKGSLGDKKDKLAVNIQAPNLNQFGLGLTGSVQTKGTLGGEFKTLQADISGQISQLAFKNLVKLQSLNFDILTSSDLDKPLKLDIKGQHFNAANIDIDHFDLISNGTLRQHGIQLSAALKIDGKKQTSTLKANGGLNHEYQWHGVVSQLNTSGAVDLNLISPFKIKVAQDFLELAQINWRVLGGRLNVDYFNWAKNKGLSSKGKASEVHLSELSPFVTLPFEHNLVFDGKWDLKYQENATGYLSITRHSGDVTLPSKKQKLNLNTLSLDTTLTQGLIKNTVKLDSQFGKGTITLDVLQNFGADLYSSAIKGSADIVLDKLAEFKYLLPIGYDLGGSLNMHLMLAGSLRNPILSGNTEAKNLLFKDHEQGITLQNGDLKAHFKDQYLMVDSLLFKENQGEIEAKGHLGFLKNGPELNLVINSRRYPLLHTMDKKVTISGDTLIQYLERQGLTLSGKLLLDKGEFDFPKSEMPQLSEDVKVAGDPTKEPSSPLPITTDLYLDLNNQFHFAGQGLDVLMGGVLHLTSKPKEAMNLNGSINILSGKYKAYGQFLEISKGHINFVGPIDNPSLNIRAKRHLSPVGVGVDVTGNARQPHLNLFADSPMSDKDKLSWLVLGRAATGSSDDDALAAAAGSILASGLNDKIGLVDDIGMTSRQKRNHTTGEMDPAEQLITIGKYLTSSLYLGYEYGIGSASQTVKLMYQVNKKFQLIGRLGSETSGGEIRYTTRFD